MLKIRLQRVGRKHDPSYRVILTDARQGPKSGKFIENLGFYDARRNIRQVKGDRVKHWISNGAQVSDTVHNILVSEQIITGKKINVLPKKKIAKKTEEKEKESTESKIVEKKEEVKKIEKSQPTDEKAPVAEKETKEETPAVEKETDKKEEK